MLGYLAPEVLLADQTADQRADVYGAGVLLWEALTGQRMHAEGEDAGEIVMRLLGGHVEAPTPPIDAPWAAPLAEVAKRAIAPDPSVRFANATAMLADVRRVVGARLAPKLTVAALVEAVAGDRIRARPVQLGVKRTIARPPTDSAWTTEAAALPVTSTRLAGGFPDRRGSDEASAVEGRIAVCARRIPSLVAAGSVRVFLPPAPGDARLRFRSRKDLWFRSRSPRRRPKGWTWSRRRRPRPRRARPTPSHHLPLGG